MSDVIAISPARQAIIDGVKAHATKNYGKNGWDILTECWSDQDIDRVMGVRTKSVLGAVQMISYYGGLREQAEQRAAAQAEAKLMTPGWDAIAGGVEGTSEEAPAPAKKARKAKKAA